MTRNTVRVQCAHTTNPFNKMTGGLNQKRYGSAAIQLISTPTYAPLAFRISIETLGHVLRTLELRS
jgi:hypothetical protein